VTQRLVLATANPDKAAEIVALFAGSSEFSVAPRPSSVGEVEETGSTLLENARLKAEAICRATNAAAMADDTGLEVEALHGAPGIYAARFAGPRATYADNVAKLLSELEPYPDPPHRRARFITVALIAFPDGTELWAQGVAEGTIASAARGAEGFGYDPVFIPDDGDGRTFAQMRADEKHSLSHRGKAFSTLRDKLLTAAQR
jgi:XTP/dITP diphosphohydrolase